MAALGAAAEFLETSRKGRKLLLNGHIFGLNRKTDTHVYWRCTQYKTCPATVTTSLENDTITHVGKNHSHEPEPAKIAIAKRTVALKKAVKEQVNLPVKRLYSEAFSAADNDDADFVAERPSYLSMKTTLYKQRRMTLPLLPRRIQEVTLEGVWAETTQGKPFLLANDGVEDKIMLFSTDENLANLSASEVIFLDGTFKVAPPFFTQMYTVHIKYLDQMIPVVYALLPSKSQEVYLRLFSLITRLCHQRLLPFQPRRVQTDFEMAAIQAARVSFPMADIKGCFFHFTQAVWRKVQDVGLVVAYKESPEIKTFVRRLAVLPLVPLQKIDDVWLDLHGMAPAEVPGVTELCDYMVNTWVDDVRPRFRRELWNHYQTLEQEGTRTNNHLESFHAAFNRSFRTAHPNIFHFVTNLKKRQDETETTVASLDVGNPPQAKYKKSRNKDARAQRILRQYQAGQRPILSFMDGMGMNIKLH